MRQIYKTCTAVALALLATATLTVQAQSTDNDRFLSLVPPAGLPIIPVLEGWIANLDGTTSYAFGIINRNDEAVTIPLGEGNYIEPAKYSGVQPTYFPPGRSTGWFTVTVPANEKDVDVWWYLTTGNSETLKVPGRCCIGAYELDYILPRPQGALQPLVGLGENGRQSPGLLAQVGDFSGRVSAGTPVTISINASDPAERDTSDPRFDGISIPMGVEFSMYQGPGEVVFTRHDSTEVLENPYEEGDRRFEFFQEPGPNQMQIKDGSGVARVIATFSEPGEYMIHTKVDMHPGPDSSNSDQCCWTNVIQRVTVSP
jgi:hypothetical protein